jgi:hypothetical protein
MAQKLTADELSEMAKGLYVDGVCCQYCRWFETPQCPVTDASPWSRWKNWCNMYTPNPDESEAKMIRLEDEK